MPEHIVVTGADSELGVRVVNALVTLGHRVDAVALATVEALEAANSAIVNDMLEGPLPESLIDERSIVVHLASVKTEEKSDVSPAKSRNAQYARTLARSRPRRVILRSSIAVSVCEREPRRATPYGLEKAEAEKILVNALPDSHLVILRPPAIYGGGLSGPLAQLSALTRKGVPLPLGLAKAQRPYLSFTNFASLLAHIVELDAKGWRLLASKPINVHDGHSISTADLVREIARVNSRKARLLPVPLTLLRLAGRVFGKQDLVSGAIDPVPAAMDTQRLRFTGWMPKTGMPESLKELSEPRRLP